MKSSFQTILLVVFGFAAAIGLLLFSGILSGDSAGGGAGETVIVWGPMDSDSLNKFFNDFNAKNKDQVQINYSARAPETYLDGLIEAFARGEGPDLFFIDQTMLNRLAGKILSIPFTSYPKRNFQDTYIDGAEIFYDGETGIKAVPLLVDPLVLYYNKTLYSSAGIALPPKTWPELVATLKPLTEIDKRNNILRSGAALGEFNNITNAKYVFSALLAQAGNPFVTTLANGDYQAILSSALGFSPTPAEMATTFYLQFSDPTKTTYSWNRSLSSDRELFAGEKLATYFGLASERSALETANPHLAFDAAIIPQGDPNRRVTYGNFIGLAIARNSKRANSAARAGLLLAGADSLDKLAAIFKRVPARRDLIAKPATDPQIQVFHEAAIIARSWVDPDAAKTQAILRQLIEDVQTGRVKIGSAADTATRQIDALFTKSVPGTQ